MRKMNRTIFVWKFSSYIFRILILQYDRSFKRIGLSTVCPQRKELHNSNTGNSIIDGESVNHTETYWKWDFWNGFKYVKTLKASAICQFCFNIEAQFVTFLSAWLDITFDDRVRTKNFRFNHCAKRLNQS